MTQENTDITQGGSENKNEKLFLSQRAVIFNPQNEKYLLVEEKIPETGKVGRWQVPGGRLDPGEELEVGFYREIEEELGLEKENFENKGYIDFNYKPLYGRANTYGAMTFRLLYYKTGAVTITEEHNDFRWQTLDEIQASDEYKDWVKEIFVKAREEQDKIEAHDKMLRTLAEFDNYKKRTEERQRDFAKYASEKVIMDMLPVLDNFHAATGFVPEDQKDSPWLTGIMYIQQQMEKVFEDANVKVITIAEGDEFDPETMEAIQSQANDNDEDTEGSDDEENEQTTKKVSKVIQKGYMIGDRVMRPARVEVN